MNMYIGHVIIGKGFQVDAVALKPDDVRRRFGQQVRFGMNALSLFHSWDRFGCHSCFIPGPFTAIPSLIKY